MQNHGPGAAASPEASPDPAAAQEASGGAVELGPGTLYRSLAEMSDAGFIQPVHAPSSDADPRRKYYRITPAGRELLSRETARLARLVEIARARQAASERA